MDFDYQELCFSIITQYKCNSICQLCPYSSLYKNIYEDEEAILLSYALSSWECLNSLKKAGLTCRHFRAMIPVSDKSKVQVVPLNRLAYEYLETVPSSANDLLSIDYKIMAALKQNNKNKLSDSDFEIMHKYLTNLTTVNSQKISDRNVADILKRCFQLEYNQKIASNPLNTTNSNISTIPSIEGLLAGKSQEHFPAKSLAIWFIKNRLLETHQITILAVKENQITFAIADEEYSFLCSIVNQVIGQYVMMNKTPPISIDEIILNDKML